MTKIISDTYEKIFELVRQIPEGKVCTYGLIAQKIGEKFSARVVGYALNNTHLGEDVPAHRVVNRNGLLTGKHHFNPSTLMQKLLENEGIKIENDKVVDFKNHLWNPSEGN
ncbi:methylated-DNA-protein-cysteine methyltransferase related protein [Algoriella xinjiangensis]|uniref:Methylated-DNA-protein-cysteine methyltransferase related protein n=1 Tax=Algoriella xinjiangensis TaxID=684065 RepID=A0A1I4W3D6_9FLAO|nr:MULTISPECIES: MGMT family protein [Algoriella]MBO6212631.1 MGMT family protein [Algoriella sp.]SFN07983.1 methylated-DNA-protein-cysteine methyltransferase related protein [Algoriella xinjiangensis]VDH15730.1 Methylated-DNA--protein-cysteine methyltransferase [Algoriella xinjiangensis]